MTTTPRDDDAIEPGDRSATRRAVLPARTLAARVAPRDADAESVAVGIAVLSVAGGDRWATTRSGSDAGLRVIVSKRDESHWQIGRDGIWRLS